jgi:hypothetical protein
MRLSTRRFHETLIILSFAFAGTPATAQSVFRAFLEAGQVVSSPQVKQPPVWQGLFSPPAALGTFYFDPFTSRLSYRVTLKTTLPGTLFSAEVRVGEIGKEGPLLFSLQRIPDGFAGTSEFLPPSQVSALLKGHLYVTVNTNLAPSGALRGQITTGHFKFSAQMVGSKVLPPATTTNYGWFSFGYSDGDQRVTYFHLETLDWSTILGIHLHEGGPTETGPVIMKLDIACPLSCNTNPLTDLQLAKLRAGHYYVDFHTTAFPGGELRGQVVPAVIEYGTGCPGTLPKPPKFIPFGTVSPITGGGIQIGPAVPYGFGLLMVGMVGAERSLGAGGCTLAIHPNAPYVVVPVALDDEGAAVFGFYSHTVLFDTWVYAQYVGADPGAPLGLHATHGIGIHYNQ